MDAVKFVNERKRMCNHSSCVLNLSKECPFAKVKGAFICSDWVQSHPEEAVAIVEKWSKEHPGKTNRDKFFEVFGIDPRPAGYVTNHNRAEGLATEWWDRPYEEPKEE